jgi:hypothetical protein
MRIIHCFPNAAIRSRVMTVATAMGVAAEEEGLCIHFHPPKDFGGLKRILDVLHAKSFGPVEGELPNPFLLRC